MATFTRLPSGKWRVQVRKKGVYKATTFDLKTQAREWAASIESQISQSQTGLITSRATLASLIDLHLDNVKDRRRAGERYLTVIQREIGHIRLDQLSQLHLEKWAEKRMQRVSGNTMASYLSRLGAVLAYGREARRLNIPPDLTKAVLRSIRRKGHDVASVRRDRIPTEDELNRLYEHWRGSRAKIPMEELVRFAIGSCMRQAEITRITFEDLDRENKTTVVRQRKNPKQKLDEVVPLVGEAWEILKEKTGTGRIFAYNPASVSREFTRACQKLEIEDLHFHDLRHAGITQLFRVGLSIQLVAIVSGHKSWEHLKRYTQLTASDVHSALTGK